MCACVGNRACVFESALGGTYLGTKRTLHTLVLPRGAGVPGSHLIDGRCLPEAPSLFFFFPPRDRLSLQSKRLPALPRLRHLLWLITLYLSVFKVVVWLFFFPVLAAFVTAVAGVEELVWSSEQDIYLREHIWTRVGRWTLAVLPQRVVCFGDNLVMWAVSQIDILYVWMTCVWAVHAAYSDKEPVATPPHHTLYFVPGSH